jgi:hypothetical protein
MAAVLPNTIPVRLMGSTAALERRALRNSDAVAATIMLINRHATIAAFTTSWIISLTGSRFTSTLLASKNA